MAGTSPGMTTRGQCPLRSPSTSAPQRSTMNVQVKPIPLNTGKPSELRDYIAMIERDHPKEILRIADEIDPAKFEATAILANLEEAGINPMVLFQRPLNQSGKATPFPLTTNIYSSRQPD